jgi:vacuolar protein sorting-associated protein 13A/C
MIIVSNTALFRGKFALSDAYEDHFMLPGRDIIVGTHRRVVLNSFTRNISAVFPFLSIIDHCRQGLPRE